MSDVVTTVIKAINGGLFVVAFAVIGELAVPRRFAGLFSAAPSIALANLIVIAIDKGAVTAQQEATGMIVGAIALVLACIVGIAAVHRMRALRGSLAICVVWLALAELGYLAVLR